MASLGLLLWCLLVRLPTFGRSVIDWDESLYALISDQWMQGHLPYTTAWDHKPVGTYVIVRLAMTLFGRSILASRLATVLFVFMAAWLLQRITARLSGSERAGLLVALVYPVFTLLLGGAASNTEHYFIALTLLGALLLLRCYQAGSTGAPRALQLALSALVFGCALQVKYLVLPELLMLGATYFFFERKRTALPQLTALLGLFGAVALVPTLAVMGYFAANGEWATFVEANFIANGRHGQGRDLARLVASSMDFVRATGGLWLVIALGWLSPLVDAEERRRRLPALLVVVVWIGAALSEALATGKYYSYYYVPAIAPTCVAFGLAVGLLRLADRSRLVMLGFAAVVVTVPLFEVVRTLYRPWARERAEYGADPQVHIASMLQKKLNPGDGIFVLNGEPILYLFVSSSLPTKFVLPPFLLDEHFSSVANVDYRKEFERIVRGAPRCVVARRDASTQDRIDEFKALLGPAYVAEQVTPDTELLCRPKDDRAAL
jgi:4-amino-4-deoxy-L-arabinose transferase-like glycosyltransferase